MYRNYFKLYLYKPLADECKKRKCVFDHGDCMTRNTPAVVSNLTKKVYYFEVYDQFQDTTKFASVKHFFSHFYPEKDSIHQGVYVY